LQDNTMIYIPQGKPDGTFASNTFHAGEDWPLALVRLVQKILMRHDGLKLNRN
jgi:hypothetical protein